MDRQIIRKQSMPPNLVDYDRSLREFSWARARLQIDGQPMGSDINIADAIVDRHLRNGRGNHVALQFTARICQLAGSLFQRLFRF